MTKFLERMREELVRRNYAASTIRTYLRIVRDFQQHTGKRLDRLGADDLRRYHAYLLEERKLAVRTVVQHVAAIRFSYCKTLKRRDMKEDFQGPIAALEHPKRFASFLRTVFRQDWVVYAKPAFGGPTRCSGISGVTRIASPSAITDSSHLMASMSLSAGRTVPTATSGAK